MGGKNKAKALENPDLSEEGNSKATKTRQSTPKKNADLAKREAVKVVETAMQKKNGDIRLAGPKNMISFIHELEDALDAIYIYNRINWKTDGDLKDYLSDVLDESDATEIIRLYRNSNKYIIDESQIIFILDRKDLATPPIAIYDFENNRWASLPHLNNQKPLKKSNITTQDSNDIPEDLKASIPIITKALNKILITEGQYGENDEQLVKRIGILERSQTPEEALKELRQIAPNLPHDLLEDLSYPLSEMALFQTEEDTGVNPAHIIGEITKARIGFMNSNPTNQQIDEMSQIFGIFLHGEG